MADNYSPIIDSTNIINSEKDLEQQLPNLSNNSSSSSSKLKDCRICFLTTNQNDLLCNPCECKGSMSYVHQVCLIRWLTQQNTRKCELCKQNFKFQERFIGIKAFFQNNIQYLISDKRRLMKLGIYIIYLYLFGKRLLILLRFFKNFIMKYILVFFRSNKQDPQQVYRSSKLLDYNLLSRLEKLKLYLLRVLYILKLFYSVFIGVQLLYLGKNELKRINRLISFMINNAKELKIQSGKLQINNQKSNNDVVDLVSDSLSYYNTD